MTRKTVLTPPKPNQFNPKWCQNVTQHGSFYGTEDGALHSPKGLYKGFFKFFWTPRNHRNTILNLPKTHPIHSQNDAKMWSKMVAFTAQKMGVPVRGGREALKGHEAVVEEAVVEEAVVEEAVEPPPGPPEPPPGPSEPSK